MTWAEFVKRWPVASLMDLGIPKRTVYVWRDGSKEPKEYHRDALEFWIEAKAGEKTAPAKDEPPRGG